MKRILVTGAAGFIGSHFVDYTLEMYPDMEVIGLDVLSYAGDEANLSGAKATGRFRFVHGDVCDFDLVSVLVQQADGVVHFAAESMVDRSVLEPDRFIQTNVVGTGVLMEAVRRHPVNRILYISTPEVYGQRLGPATGEHEAFNPRNVYAASKAGAEMICLAYLHSYEIPVLFTRGAVAIGPRQYPEKVAAFWITKALDSEKLPLYGDGTAVRDFLHVRDLVSANDIVFRSGVIGEAYNVAGYEWSLSQLAEGILQRTGGRLSQLATAHHDRPGHDYRYHMDDSKIRALGWSPTCPMDQALSQTVAWYATNREWWERKKRSKDFMSYLSRNVSLNPTSGAKS